MASLKSLLNLRKIATMTLIFVCWATKVPPKLNWVNEEFNFALRSYEYKWQTNLSDEEALKWQRDYTRAYLDWLENAVPEKGAALARGDYR